MSDTMVTSVDAENASLTAEDEAELKAYMEMMATKGVVLERTDEGRTFVNNVPLIETRHNDIRIDKPTAAQLREFKGQEVEFVFPWSETMAVTINERHSLEGKDAEDDMKRELCFITQALAAAKEAKESCERENIPFFRPDDFFAEMIKSDMHMNRIRQELVKEAKGIKAAEEAKKNRHAKKFNQSVQKQKKFEREKQDRAFSLIKSKKSQNKAASSKGAHSKSKLEPMSKKQSKGAKNFTKPKQKRAKKH